MKDEALKQALEALENLFGIPDKWTGEGGGDVAVWRLGGSYRAQQAITAIKQALEAPVQEPVAWINAEKRTFEWNGPVLWNTPTVAILDKIPLYTTPPAQRQWVGLTPREIYNLWEDSGVPFVDWDSFASITRAIEQALKEKNT